jgi:hypothetical protein
MKVGDLVRETGGHSCAGETGIILSITTNPAGNTVARVHSCGAIKHWWAEWIEVIK